MRIRLLILLVAVLSAVPLEGQASASSCDSLATLALKDTTITLAQLVPAGQFSAPGERQAAGRGVNPYKDLSEFCRVAATLTPTSDSDIKVEVWLPASWLERQVPGRRQRRLGRSRSAIPPWPTPSAPGMRARPPTPGMWEAAGRLRSIILKSSIDFAWRSEHEMTVKAKAVIQAFYGSAPRLSYWNGCSTGGRQGLKEAQKFPDDYDGIIAGAPANRTAISLWIAARRAEGPGQLHPAQQVSDHPPGRSRRLRRARRAQGRPHRRPDQMRIRSRSAALQGRGRSRLSDRAAGGSGEEDLFSRHQPAYRTGAVFVAGAGNGTGLGRSGPGSGTVGQYLRSVSIRRLQRPQLGLEDVQLRQRRGAWRPAGKPDHERHRSEHEAVLLTRRETAALSRLERPQCPDAEHHQVLQERR